MATASACRLPRGWDRLTQADLGVPSRLQPWHGSPFLIEAAVEHYPIPTTPDGRSRTGGPENGGDTGVNLVFHAETPRDHRYDTTLIGVLRAQGWRVDDKIDH